VKSDEFSFVSVCGHASRQHAHANASESEGFDEMEITARKAPNGEHVTHAKSVNQVLALRDSTGEDERPVFEHFNGSLERRFSVVDVVCRDNRGLDEEIHGIVEKFRQDERCVRPWVHDESEVDFSFEHRIRHGSGSAIPQADFDRGCRMQKFFQESW
jgi:hypothetical protein